MIVACSENDGNPSNNHSSNITSSLIGTWTTESCEQGTDINGSLVSIWSRGLYEFTSTGTIKKGNETYLDSNCVSLNNTQLPSELPEPVIFNDLGELLLQEGINGGSLFIQMTFGSQTQSNTAFYTINSNSLCFSDVFAFQALTFSVYPSGSTAINFNRCLTQP